MELWGRPLESLARADPKSISHKPPLIKSFALKNSSHSNRSLFQDHSTLQSMHVVLNRSRSLSFSLFSNQSRSLSELGIVYEILVLVYLFLFVVHVLFCSFVQSISQSFLFSLFSSYCLLGKKATIIIVVNLVFYLEYFG